jgi:flagellar hook-length control protein FliK
VRFAHRVARAFESIGDRGGTVRLRLHPPELGSLRVEVTVRAGAMTARLEAETAAAKSLLLESLPALRDRLGEQNIRVERFDVDLADRSAGGSDDRFRGDAGPRDHHHRQSQSPQPAGGEAATGDVAGRRGLFPYAVPGRLDVII